jgi:hypothetical protein
MTGKMMGILMELEDERSMDIERRLNGRTIVSPRRAVGKNVGGGM